MGDFIFRGTTHIISMGGLATKGKREGSHRLQPKVSIHGLEEGIFRRNFNTSKRDGKENKKYKKEKGREKGKFPFGKNG